MSTINIDKILEKYSFIKDLKENWDGEGAEEINVENWNTLEKTLKDIFFNIPKDLIDEFNAFQEPFIMPGFQGDIHFSIDGKGYKIGCGIFKGGKIVYNVKKGKRNLGGNFSLEKFYLTLRKIK